MKQANNEKQTLVTNSEGLKKVENKQIEILRYDRNPNKAMSWKKRLKIEM